MTLQIPSLAVASAIAAAALLSPHADANAKSYTTKSCSSTLVTGTAKGKQYNQAQTIAQAKNNWMALTGASWNQAKDKSTNCEPWHPTVVQCFAKARPCKTVKQQIPQAQVPLPNLGSPGWTRPGNSNVFAITPPRTSGGGGGGFSGIRMRGRH